MNLSVCVCMNKGGEQIWTEFSGSLRHKRNDRERYSDGNAYAVRG